MSTYDPELKIDPNILHEVPILRFFGYAHLPPDLIEVSRAFAQLALLMVETLPRSGEHTAGLRKLLEAKDCFVRAALPPPSR
jgi:hypothetical protein